MRRLRALRLLVVLVAVLVGTFAIAHANVACDSFEEPCRVTKSTVVLNDSTINILPTIELTRSKDRAIALWLRRELPDGGVGEAGADAGGDAGPDPDALFPMFAPIDLVMLDANGALAFHTKIDPPDALRTRQDSLGGLDVVVEDGAFLLHWTETTTTTDPDGRLRKAGATKLAYALGDGSASSMTTGTSFAPPSAACEHCVITPASVALPTESILFLRFDHDVIDSVLGEPLPVPTFAALRIRRDGTIINESVPWLTLPNVALDGGIGGLTSAANADLNAYVDSLGRIVVTSGGFAWLVDVTLHLFSGPIHLPTGSDVVASFDAEGAASIAWSLSPFEDGRSDNDQVPREIFTGLVPRGNFVVATEERTSRGRLLLGMDRRGADVGVLFESAGRNFFASLDVNGIKRGGDVLIDGNAGTMPISEYGLPTLNNASLLFATGASGANPSFRAITFGSGRIVTTEISCNAP